MDKYVFIKIYLLKIANRGTAAYFSIAAIEAFKAAIFASASLYFLRSASTTAAGALLTKRSLDSFLRVI